MEQKSRKELLKTALEERLKEKKPEENAIIGLDAVDIEARPEPVKGLVDNTCK